MGIRDQLKSMKRTLAPIKFGEVECFVRIWTEREHIEWAVVCQAAKAAANATDEEDEVADLWLRCKVLAKSLADAEGNLLFENFEEVADLASADQIDGVFEETCRLQSRKKDDAKKNSTEASPSNSV